MNLFERYLSLWVGLCMVVGVVLGLSAPGMMQGLRSLEFGSGSQIVVDTDEPDRRLELLHRVRKYGTVFNTVAPGTDLKVSSFGRSDKHVAREDAHAAVSPSLFGCREGRHARGRRLGG